MGAAIKTLATAHHGSGAPLQPADIARRQRSAQRLLDLDLRRQLTMADDLTITWLGVAAGPMLGQVRDRRPNWGCFLQGAEMLGMESSDTLGDAERTGEAGGANAGCRDPIAVRQCFDLIVLELRGRP